MSAGVKLIEAALALLSFACGGGGGGPPAVRRWAWAGAHSARLTQGSLAAGPAGSVSDGPGHRLAGHSRSHESLDRVGTKSRAREL